MKKGVYPYEFMDGFEKFEKRQLPKKTSFFSRLNQEKVTDENYQRAQRVWEEFEIKNMGEFHDLYLKTDVLLLADVKTLSLGSCSFLHHPRACLGCHAENDRREAGTAGRC